MLCLIDIKSYQACSRIHYVRDCYGLALESQQGLFPTWREYAASTCALAYSCLSPSAVNITSFLPSRPSCVFSLCPL
jgi:hypothetical protein